MSKARLLLIALGAFYVIPTFANDDGWANLFDGSSLSGWKKVAGDATYQAVDGMIIGTTVKNTGNTFLITEKEYGDFILELDVKIEGSHNNSGIQTRSHLNPQANQGKGRVFGRQIEIDPSERSWSGGVYDEARRNWLYPLELNPKAKSAFRKNEFNHIRIVCIGDETITWINQVPVSYVVDTLDKTGFIGLQVHAIGKDGEAGKRVYFKNIRIKTSDLAVPKIKDDIYVVNYQPNHLSRKELNDGYKLLYDGQSNQGWHSAASNVFPKVGWDYAHGRLQVRATEGTSLTRGGDIVTNNTYHAFDLSFEFRLTPGANSGLKYFVVIDKDGKNAPLGLEYQVLDDEKHPDAKLGRNGNRKLGSLYDLIPAEKQTRFLRPIGHWNNGRIIVYPNGQVEHYLNGVKVVSYKRGTADFKEIVALSKFKNQPNFGEAKRGHILLQDHGNEVSFRSIKIKEL